jgi:hypothetical protein
VDQTISYKEAVVENSGASDMDLKMKLLEKCKPWLPVSPVVLLFAFGESFVWFKELNQLTVLYFLVAGIVAMGMWMTYDSRKSISDFMVAMSLHNIIDPIDRDAQAEIHDGLLGTSLISEEESDLTQKLLRGAVNSIAVQALVPSAYHNHHARELIEHGDERYVARKKSLVYKAFSVADPEYKEIVAASFPSTVPNMTKEERFDAAIEAFVCKWIRKTVIPAASYASERKVQEYSRLCKMSTTSRRFKQKMAEHMDKNTRYIAALTALKKHKGVSVHSTIIGPPETESRQGEKA